MFGGSTGSKISVAAVALSVMCGALISSALIGNGVTPHLQSDSARVFIKQDT